MTVADVIADMRAHADAHAQWAMTPDATTAEASASVTIAAQIRRWMSALESATLSPARLTDLESGKAIGSADKTP